MSLRRTSHYAVAVASVALAAILNGILWRLIQPQISPLFFAAVLFSAWYGGLGPGLVATGLAGFISVFFFVEPVYSMQADLSDLLRLAVFLLVAIMISALNKARKNAEQATSKAHVHGERLRDMALGLVATEQRERHLLATQLHDEISQPLAVMEMELDALLKGSPSVDLSESVNRLKRLVERVIGQTRQLTSELSPQILYELGLEPALSWLADQMQKRYSFSIGFEDDGHFQPLDREQNVLIFHAVRELLMNVAKHARARRAKVCIRKDGRSVHVTVEDDGIGCGNSPAGLQAVPSGGFGLFSIRERLTHVGGHLRIESDSGHGTLCTLILPVQHTDGHLRSQNEG